MDIMFNQRNYKDPWLTTHIARSFENTCEINFEGRISHTLFEHFEAWVQVLEEQPFLSLEMFDVMPSVDKSGYKARVWCVKEITNRENHIKRESICEQLWEQRDRVWRCVKMTSLTGNIELDFDPEP